MSSPTTGVDPLTGLERRRWIPIDHDRTEAEAVVARLDSEDKAIHGSPNAASSSGSEDKTARRQGLRQDLRSIRIGSAG